VFIDFEGVPEEILDAGPERVIVIWHLTGTAARLGRRIWRLVYTTQIPPPPPVQINRSKSGNAELS
jgi:hypothetical protein